VHNDAGLTPANVPQSSGSGDHFRVIGIGSSLGGSK